MFVRKIVVICAIALFVCCESAFVDTLGKCEITDGKCQKGLLENAVRSIAKTGVPELELPPIDPVHLKNVSVSVLDLVDITLLDGVAKGVKNCIFNDFVTNIEDEHASLEIICDITIKGLYKVYSASPLIKNLLGGDSIHGEGNAKVKLEKMRIKFDFYFYPERREDGEIYMKCKYNEFRYKYDILGKATFNADNLYLGDQEISKIVTGFLNENWKTILATFGKAFVDKAMEITYTYTHKFFDHVPVKYYISSDLTPYLKN